MKLIVTTTLLFYFTFTILAQEERIMINGLVTSNNFAIENVHILNLNTGLGEVTSLNGKFTIKIKNGDIIKISHIEYQSQKIITTNKIIIDGLIIILKRAINRLNNVIIKNHNLSGILYSDSNEQIKKNGIGSNKFIQELMELSKLPSKYDNVKRIESQYINDVNPIKMNGGVGIGIVIRDKENELRRELREAKNIPEQIINDFGKKYFINELEVSEEKIHNFLTYCNYRNIFELYKKKKIMRVIEILEIESVSYHKKMNKKNR